MSDGLAPPTTYPVPQMAMALMRRVDAECVAVRNATADEVVALLRIDSDANDVTVDFTTGVVTVTPKAEE